MSPAIDYCLFKEIQPDAFRLSASAHKDHGAEVCVGNFIYFQYGKYIEELKANLRAQTSSSNSTSRLELVVDDAALDEAWGTGGSGGPGIEKSQVDEEEEQ